MDMAPFKMDATACLNRIPDIGKSWALQLETNEASPASVARVCRDRIQRVLVCKNTRSIVRIHSSRF